MTEARLEASPALARTPARGVVHVIVVGFTSVTPVATTVGDVAPKNGLAALRKTTVGVPPAKPVPVIVMKVGFSESTVARLEAVTVGVLSFRWIVKHMPVLREHPEYKGIDLERSTS